MKNLFTLFLSVFVVNETFVCWPDGPMLSDGDLHTFTDVNCLEFPPSTKASSCLQGEILDLEQTLNLLSNQ